MTPNVDAHRYRAQARTVGDGIGDVAVIDASISFDRSWPNPDRLTLPGPGELLAAAFAACFIKNVQRFSQILPFTYDSAVIDVELHRHDHPPRFDRVDYVLRLATDEPAARVDLLARNLAKYGTVHNTLAGGCQISGHIETTPPPTTASTDPTAVDDVHRSTFDSSTECLRALPGCDLNTVAQAGRWNEVGQTAENLDSRVTTIETVQITGNGTATWWRARSTPVFTATLAELSSMTSFKARGLPASSNSPTASGRSSAPRTKRLAQVREATYAQADEPSADIRSRCGQLCSVTVVSS